MLFGECLILLKMTEYEKAQLLEGLDEYYASRTDLQDIGNSDERTKVINGVTYVAVNMSTEEWAKQNDAISIEETFFCDIKR